MRVVKLLDTVLNSSTVAGSSYDEYDSVNPYDSGDYVKVSFESDGVTPRSPVEEYKSLSDTNTGNYPPDDTTNWVLVGIENKTQMFDGYLNTATKDTTSFTVEMDSSGADAVGLFALQAKSLDFTLTRNGSTIKSEAINLMTMLGADHWSYYNTDAEFINRYLWDFPRYASSTLSITITHFTGETVQCGWCSVGKQIPLGTTEDEPVISLYSYTKETTDEIGRTSLTKGNNAPKGDISFWMPSNRINGIDRILTEVEGTVCIFDCNNEGEDQQSSLLVAGYAPSYELMVKGTLRSKGNIELKGVI